jgi:hypothetical protein
MLYTYSKSSCIPHSSQPQRSLTLAKTALRLPLRLAARHARGLARARRSRYDLHDHRPVTVPSVIHAHAHDMPACTFHVFIVTSSTLNRVRSLSFSGDTARRVHAPLSARHLLSVSPRVLLCHALSPLSLMLSLNRPAPSHDELRAGLGPRRAMLRSANSRVTLLLNQLRPRCCCCRPARLRTPGRPAAATAAEERPAERRYPAR